MGKKQQITFLAGLTLIIILLIVIFSGGRKLKKYKKENINYQIEQTNLQYRISVSNAMIKTKDREITSLGDSVRNHKHQLDSIRQVGIQTKKDYEKRIADLSNIPPDSSYKYLIAVAYPYTGQLKYPFNSLQVKAIHRGYEENVFLRQETTNLRLSFQLSEEKSVFQEGIIDGYKGKEVEYRTIIANQDTINNLCNNRLIEANKVVKKANNRRKFWKRIGIAGVIYAIGSIVF